MCGTNNSNTFNRERERKGESERESERVRGRERERVKGIVKGGRKICDKLKKIYCENIYMFSNTLLTERPHGDPMEISTESARIPKLHIQRLRARRPLGPAGRPLYNTTDRRVKSSFFLAKFN